ncbi:MAG: DNA ligase D [Myxococcota bacterium]
MKTKRRLNRLEAYRRKRRFDITPEPAPGKQAAPPGHLRFVVHKHDARRMHYDLRLQIQGALASWAIPKGPSYDPAAKRLAVETEDHPLEYAGFEGRIPEGEYGAGDSILWDAGTYQTVPPGQEAAMRQKGHLQFELFGQKLRGRWHLVRTRRPTGKPQWLFFKAKDGAEKASYDVVAARPQSVRSGRVLTRGPQRKTTLRGPHPEPAALLKKLWPPMLAQPSTARALGPDYLLEVKYDGFRALAALSRGELSLLSRNRLDLTGRFPEVAGALSRLQVGEAVLDGEVVALDAKGVSHFQLLHEPRADRRYVAFDLLWLDGEDLRRRPLEQRHDLLESVLANAPASLLVAERLATPLEEALIEVRRRGLEGLLAKRRGSPYLGRRSREWLKLKVTHSQEVAIAGYSPTRSRRKEIGALLLAVYEDAGFSYAGKVGTGFSSAQRSVLWELLQPRAVGTPPVKNPPRERSMVWVRPELVAQVGFKEWTRDGRLRAPTFLGLRPDKQPRECIREVPVRAQSPPPAPTLPKEVALSSGSKVMFPRSGITKADVYAYYRHVAEVMVHALEGRPLALQQWPKGIHHPGFFRHELSAAPAWMTTVKLPHDDKTVEHLVVDRPETLLWLANQNALTLHMWASRVGHLEEPDWAVFDLDPGKGGWEDLVHVANVLRGFLEELHLSSVVKTSGKRGLHVLVPMARGHTHEDAVDFAVAITQTLAAGLPLLATTERTKSKRRGRLYLDAFQNGYGKTVVAPYTLRALEGAPVSAPLHWSEVTPALDPSALNLRTMRARLDKYGDLFAPALTGGQRLPRFGTD